MNILFISLGCDKNLVDSEVMLGLLDKKGYQIVDSEEDADIIVVNTCCFIHDAKEESIQTILEMAEYKKEGKLKALIVTGCLAQRYQQEIIDEIPEVDAVLGTTSYDHIVEAVEEALAGNGHVVLEDVDALPDVKEKRLVTTGGHYAYMKIAEGCDKHCTYCIIPKVRGNYRSVKMEYLIDEAKKLAEEEKQKAEEEKRKAEEAESRAGKAIERNYRLIVNILSGRTYEEAADMLGISIEDVKEAEAAIKAIDK